MRLEGTPRCFRVTGAVCTGRCAAGGGANLSAGSTGPAQASPGTPKFMTEVTEPSADDLAATIKDLPGKGDKLLAARTRSYALSYRRRIAEQ